MTARSRSVALAALFLTLLLSACDDSDTGNDRARSTQASASPATETELPALEAGSSFPVSFDGWERDQLEMPGEGEDETVAIYRSTDDGRRVIAYSGGTLNEMARDFSASGNARGLACGTAGQYGRACHYELDGGHLFVIPIQDYMTSEGVTDSFTDDELRTVVTQLVEAMAASTSPTERDTCSEIALERAQELLAPELRGSDLTLDEEYTFNEPGMGYRCTFGFVEGAFSGGSGPTLLNTSEFGGNFSYERYAYAEGQAYGVGLSCEYGGSSFEEVLSSTRNCKFETDDVTERTASGGIVLVNGHGQFVLATDGDHWYQGGVSGVPAGASFDAVVLTFAEELAAAAQ